MSTTTCTDCGAEMRDDIDKDLNGQQCPGCKMFYVTPDQFLIGGITGFEPVYCEWYAKCTKQANGLRHHPVIGWVPICVRCDEKTSRLERA